MNREFLEALNELEKERGNKKKEIILEALEAALVSAYKKTSLPPRTSEWKSIVEQGKSKFLPVR